MNMNSLSNRNKQTQEPIAMMEVYICVYMGFMGTKRKSAWTESGKVKAAGEGFFKEMLLRNI